MNLNAVTIYRPSTDSVKPAIPVRTLERLIRDVDSLPVWSLFRGPEVGAARNFRILDDELVADLVIDSTSLEVDMRYSMLSIGATLDEKTGDLSNLQVAVCNESTWQTERDVDSMKRAVKDGVWPR